MNIVNVNKEDKAAIKVLVATKMMQNAAMELSPAHIKKHNEAIARLKSRFGKEWLKICEDWREIENMKREQHPSAKVIGKSKSAPVSGVENEV